ncbi:type II toxin-antitoxin system RelE/ParE family toxin [Brevundimonas staleyi]|uniref:Type II toxin-antitoxin system RelE/ParE family toxin n=1 Tax=Brevundimonas staleyi TaxID=74326 RepID=A0ABW0FN17_9CAUL
MRRILLDITARFDTVAVVNTSFTSFGRLAADRYGVLINQAYRDLAMDPERVGAKPFENGIYLYHLRNSRKGTPPPDRVARPRHLIAYRFDDEMIQIIRLLHDRMDVAAHVQGVRNR